MRGGLITHLISGFSLRSMNALVHLLLHLAQLHGGLVLGPVGTTQLVTPRAADLCLLFDQLFLLFRFWLSSPAAASMSLFHECVSSRTPIILIIFSYGWTDGYRLMARARFSISEFCCLISLTKIMMTFSSCGISLGSVRLRFWYSVAAISLLEDSRGLTSALFCGKDPLSALRFEQRRTRITDG